MGVYKKYVYTGIPAAKVKAFSESLTAVDTKGMTSSGISYDPKTETLTHYVGIDEEELPALTDSASELAALDSRITSSGSTELGKAPTKEDVTDGSTGLTGRDRGRQFLQALADGIDPRDIGVEAPVDTKEARIEVLRRYAAASKAHFNLPDPVKKNEAVDGVIGG